MMTGTNTDAKSDLMLRRAMRFAQSLGHLNVRPEHVLYAYFTFESSRNSLLHILKIDKIVRAIVRNAVGADAAEADEELEFSPTMEAIIRELDETAMGHDQAIEPQHILYAIFRHDDNAACDIAEEITNKTTADLRQHLKGFPVSV